MKKRKNVPNYKVIEKLLVEIWQSQQEEPREKTELRRNLDS